MTLNEAIVEEAALEWFGELNRVAPTLIPPVSQREKKEASEAIRRLNPAIPKETRATLRRFRMVQIERRPNP